MRDDIVLSVDQIQTINRRLGRQLTQRLKDEEKLPVVVAVMKGALFFYSDLVRQIKCPILLDFVKVSSYVGTQSTGRLKIDRDISMDIQGSTVVLVEDVVDTGLTMYYLKEHLFSHYKPKQILIATLFDKKPLRKLEVDVDFCGKELDEPKFLMGYGLDYCELDRNIPFVYSASEEDLERMNVDKER